jgi:hypothetical protein
VTILKKDLVKENVKVKRKATDKCPTIVKKDIKIKGKRTPEDKIKNDISPVKTEKSKSAGKGEDGGKKKSSTKKKQKVIVVPVPEVIDFASLIQGPTKSSKKLEEEVIKKEDNALMNASTNSSS